MFQTSTCARAAAARDYHLINRAHSGANVPSCQTASCASLTFCCFVSHKRASGSRNKPGLPSLVAPPNRERAGGPDPFEPRGRDAGVRAPTHRASHFFLPSPIHPSASSPPGTQPPPRLRPYQHGRDGLSLESTRPHPSLPEPPERGGAAREPFPRPPTPTRLQGKPRLAPFAAP